MGSSSSLPEVIALLNFLSFVCLVSGFISVKTGRVMLHRLFMSAALVFSVLFLAVYLVHHYQVGSVPYPRHDWTYILYLVILVPHIILAVVMLPFIVLAFRHAIKNDIVKHKKIVRYLFPVWTYVSLTGIIVYFMLYYLE